MYYNLFKTCKPRPDFLRWHAFYTEEEARDQSVHYLDMHDMVEYIKTIELPDGIELCDEAVEEEYPQVFSEDDGYIYYA